MKTHAIKKYRIQKLFDPALIVVTMSFITFYVLKSMVSFPDLLNRPETSPSFQAKLATAHQETGNVVLEHPVRGTNAIGAVYTDKSYSAVQSSQATSNLSSIVNYLEPAVEERLHLEAWMVDQSLWLPVSVEITDNANRAESKGSEIFDTQTYLSGRIKINDAFAAEADPPLKLEVWMVDEDVFTTTITITEN